MSQRGPSVGSGMKLKVIGSILLTCLAISGCADRSPGDDSKEDGLSPTVGQETEVSQTLADPKLEMTMQIYGLTEIPQASLVKEVMPSDWQETHVKCLEDAGWFEGPEGGYSFPDSQREALGIAMYVCLVQYPVAAKFRETITDEHLVRGYEYYRDVIIPCFQENGFKTRELPSFEVFKSTAGTSEEYFVLDDEIYNDPTIDLPGICTLAPSAEVLYGVPEAD